MYQIIIADDEAIECRALEMMIRNDFPMLQTLPSASNGAELIAGVRKYHPDIAVVDINMPQLSGLDAMELIRAENHEMKIIIVTAYSEFDYARRALKLGVADYLLKPVDRKTFRETISKILQTMDREQINSSRDRSTRQHMDEMTEAVGSEFLFSLIFGEPDEKSLQLYLASLDQPFNGGCIAAARPADQPGWALLGKKQQQDMTKDIQNELDRYCRAVVREYKNEFYFLLLPGNHLTETELKKWLDDVLGMVQRLLKKKWNLAFNFGVSGCKFVSGEMLEGMSECVIAMRSRTRPGINHYDSNTDMHQENPFLPLAKMCLTCIKTGEIGTCRQKIHEFLVQHIPEDADVYEVMQVQILETMVPVFAYQEAAQDYSMRYSKNAQADLNGLHECYSRGQVEKWINENIEKLDPAGGNGKRKVNDYVRKAVLFMEKNYMDDISLERTAESAGISSFYLSRLLKQELNQNFTDILTDIRMRKAMQLIWDRKLTVREIAEQCGYSNITYFYKVFKKYTGRSVGQIRSILK